MEISARPPSNADPDRKRNDFMLKLQTVEKMKAVGYQNPGSSSAAINHRRGPISPLVRLKLNLTLLP
jgi:hypothetical protein